MASLPVRRHFCLDTGNLLSVFRSLSYPPNRAVLRPNAAVRVVLKTRLHVTLGIVSTKAKEEDYV